MGTYRIYRLDGTGRISGVETLDALDDRWALEAARAIAEPGGCEVWQRDRKLGAVPGPVITPRDAPDRAARPSGGRPTARIW